MHIHDTSFIVAHFHYVMFGGTGFGIFAALHFWFPKMFGRKYNLQKAKYGFWTLFVGFNLLYFPLFVMGWLGMPRRYYDYLPEYHIYHLVSTIGSWILILGLIIMFGNFIYALLKGEQTSEVNPWGGETLEWHVPTPPPLENFDEIPTVETDPYQYVQNNSDNVLVKEAN